MSLFWGKMFNEGGMFAVNGRLMRSGDSRSIPDQTEKRFQDFPNFYSSRQPQEPWIFIGCRFRKICWLVRLMKISSFGYTTIQKVTGSNWWNVCKDLLVTFIQIELKAPIKEIYMWILWTFQRKIWYLERLSLTQGSVMNIWFLPFCKDNSFYFSLLLK